MTTIYALQDPITEDIRYIGRTKNPHMRLFSHMSCKDNKDKWDWVCALKALNFKPKMICLDEVDSDIDFWELHYINLYQSWGFRLVNKMTHINMPNKKWVKKPSDTMRKEIELPDDKIKELKKIAIEAGFSFKAWIEYVVLKHLK